MTKYYSFETLSDALRDGLRYFLRSLHIRYELSGCFTGWHFEITCTAEEAQQVNDWLDIYA